MDFEPQAADRPRAPHTALLSVFEDGLREHFPGLEVLDRDLELPSLGAQAAARRADFVGLDRLGRLLLVLVVEGEDDEVFLATSDALTLARTHGDLLARHLHLRREGSDGERTAQSGAVLVVLAAQVFSPRLIQRLALLPTAELRLFEVAALISARRAGSYFVPVSLSSAAGLRRSFTSAEFVAGLDERDRALAELALRRIARIDRELVTDFGEERLGWHFDDRPLCSLLRLDSRLAGEIPAEDVSLPLRDAAALEGFLDRVMRAHLRSLLDEDAQAPAAGVLADARLHEPILSAEEIAAFRD